MNAKLINPPVMNACASILFSAIQRADVTPIFLDARVNTSEYMVDELQLQVELGQPSASASRFAARHLRTGNIIFADSHGESRRGPTVVETRPGRNRGTAIFPDGDISWCPDPLMDPKPQD